MTYLNSNGKKPRLSRLLPRFETRAQARERNGVIVRHLKAGERAARQVGRKLRRCRKDRLCASPYCPRCVRGLRASFVRGAMNCIDQVRKADGIPADQIVAFSAALTEEQHPAGSLHNADLRRIAARQTG
jgi:plasmid stabilization system protein ParE